MPVPASRWEAPPAVLQCPQRRAPVVKLQLVLAAALRRREATSVWALLVKERRAEQAE
jgi:hypothetical protein